MSQKNKKHTLISLRRVLTEPNIASAIGGILEILARFKASMALFNAGIASSRPLGRWDLASMTEARGSCGGTVRREGGEESEE